LKFREIEVMLSVAVKVFFVRSIAFYCSLMLISVFKRGELKYA